MTGAAVESAAQQVGNTAPVAVAQTLTTPEDTALNIVLGGTDVDGNALTYTYTQPAHGTVSGTAPNVTYTPAANYNSETPDSFTFKANDGTSDSNIATVTITVTAVNDVPTASDVSVETLEGTAVEVQLSGADEDEEALTGTIVVGPAHGTLGEIDDETTM